MRLCLQHACAASFGFYFTSATEAHARRLKGAKLHQCWVSLDERRLFAERDRDESRCTMSSFCEPPSLVTHPELIYGREFPSMVPGARRGDSRAHHVE